MTPNLPPESGLASSHASANGDAARVEPAADRGAPELGHSHVPINYAPRTRVGVTVFAIVAAVLLIVAFAWVEHSRRTAETRLASDVEHASAEPVTLDVIPVTRGAPEKVLSLPGDARAFYQTTIFGRVSGYVQKWNADVGDKVKKGDHLAVIETPELDDQLRAANAKLAQLQSDVHVAETSAHFAKVSSERWEAAAKGGEGAVSGQERDEKKAEYESSLAKLDAAKSAVTLGEAEVARLETLESFKLVRAPFDGIITRRNVDPGDLVTAGSTSNTTPMYTLAQYDRVRVWVDVPQPAVPDIHVGMHATATSRELPGQVLTGVVDRTREAIDPVSRTLGVEVLVPNPNLSLLPGMYVEVNFSTSRKNPPLRIPASALVAGPNGSEVAVVDREGRVNFRPIAIARDMGDAIEVASGLNEGDRVGLNVGNQVVDGQRVEARLLEAEPAKPEPSAARTAEASGAGQSGPNNPR